MDDLITHIREKCMQVEAMQRIMRYIPCIIHCKDCCGIKVREMFLIEGLSNAQGELLAQQEESGTMKQREDNYIKKIKKY